MRSQKFHAAIWEICRKQVIPLNRRNPKDRALLNDTHRVALRVCNSLKKTPIVSTRVNEVGNKIEKPVMDFFNRMRKYKASVPLDKPSGYPDILLQR